MNEESLAYELGQFGKVLNVNLVRTEYEAHATVLMAHGMEASKAMDLLQRKYRLSVQLEQIDTAWSQMRELWVGNLSQTVTQEKLWNRFFIYGEIEVVYMFMSNNFAFVRFKEIAAAARALDLARGARIDGRCVKLSFADPVRRREAVGDLPGYRLTPDSAKALVLKYTGSVLTPQEDFLKGMLSKYGSVRAILVAEVDAKPFAKPRVFVEFATHVSSHLIV